MPNLRPADFEDMTSRMSKINLGTLPKELIAHIASFATASAILRLSLTSQAIRAASWDALVFKAILTASQRDLWNDDSLDLEAIASRAGADTKTWAQYALADQRARPLAGDESLSTPPRYYINFLPELFVVKHPLTSDPCWKDGISYRRDQPPCQLFCLVMTVLAAKDNMPEVLKGLHTQGFPRSSSSVGPYLWALCVIALTARTAIRTRLAAWPYNSAARVPFIELPKASEIPLRRLDDAYDLPAPFSRRAVELLGKPTSSFNSWDSWYRLHNYSAFQSPTYLFEGTWCGYYVHFDRPPLTVAIDAPMIDIQFHSNGEAAQDTSSTNDSEVRFRAWNCVDGVDSFDLNGIMAYSDSEVEITARKQYQSSNLGWDWDCRLTPFGIVGYWGTSLAPRGEPGVLRRQGIVWLWKKAWTEA